MSREQHQLTIATIAVESPMGAQNYQRQIIERASDALNARDPRGWRVTPMIVRSMRSPLSGDRRLPLRALSSAPTRVRRAAGRALYGRSQIVHRMALELPPTPDIDVITLHDVVAWRFPDESAPVPSAIEEAQRAAAVICVSEFTACEAVEFLGISSPHIVPNGVDSRFFDAVPLGVDALARLGIHGPFVLHAGGAAKRKNLDALAGAWPTVHRQRPGLQLSLAGPPHPRRNELFEGMPGVVLLGRIADDLMPGLVAAASAVVVPSLYEGFGLPVLEAMAAGTIVVAANTSSLPEVAGDAAIVVEPMTDAIADGILTATSDDAAVGALVTAGRTRAAQFTWERSASDHARIWASLT